MDTLTIPRRQRCRRVEIVPADLVIGPCDQCADCGQPGSWEVDHWQVCPERARNDLHRVLMGADR